MSSSKVSTRVDDSIIRTSVQVETLPAVVDYDDILDACEIVPDDDSREAPWESCDGYEHDFETLDNRHDARGAIYSEDIRIVLNPDPATYRYFRSIGMSKQTAAEMTALQNRRTLDQLVSWHSSGWEWYGVTCEFMGHHDSLWGIDSYDYAHDGVRHDIAAEIAAKLETEGFTVTNRPDPRKANRDAKLHRLRRNLKLDCWTD